MKKSLLVLGIVGVLITGVVLSPIKTLEKQLNLKTWEIWGHLEVLGFTIDKIDYTMDYSDQFAKHSSLTTDKYVLVSLSRGWLWSSADDLNKVESTSREGPALSYLHCAFLTSRRGNPEYIAEIVRLSETEVAELEERMWETGHE